MYIGVISLTEMEMTAILQRTMQVFINNINSHNNIQLTLDEVMPDVIGLHGVDSKRPFPGADETLVGINQTLIDIHVVLESVLNSGLNVWTKQG